MLPADASAMVLAAGRATRMRPLTERRAKAVVPFLNLPLLDHTLGWLQHSGCRQVVLNLHHGGESIVRTYGLRAFDMDIVYSHEPVLLGTAGGPRRALDRLGDPVLIVNGDVVSRIALGPMAAHHVAVGALATLALHTGEATRGYPKVGAAADGRLLAFPGSPEAADAPVRGTFTGVHLVQREVIEMVPVDVACGIVDTVYARLLAAGLPLHALPVPGTWYEAGDPRRYIDNQLSCLMRGAAPLSVAGHRRFVGGGFASRHAHLENIRLRPPFLIGAGARIKHGARLQGAVIGDRTWVESGARLREVVAWTDACIGPRCDLRRVIVMDGVVVPPGTEAVDTVFAPAGPVGFAERA